MKTVQHDFKTICIDFDGVIHKYSQGWNDGNIYDAPVKYCFRAMCNLQEKGYKIYILTAREEDDWKAVSDYIKTWNKIFEPNRELEFTVSNIKVAAIAYIDDRAIRFTNWIDMENYFY